MMGVIAFPHQETSFYFIAACLLLSRCAIRGKDLREVADREQTGVASEEDMERYFTEVFPLHWYHFKPEYLSGILGKTVFNREIGPYLQPRLRQEYDLRSQLADITTPTLVLHGRHD